MPDMLGCTCNLSTRKQKDSELQISLELRPEPVGCSEYQNNDLILDESGAIHLKSFYSYRISTLTLPEEGDAMVLHGMTRISE